MEQPPHYFVESTQKVLFHKAGRKMNGYPVEVIVKSCIVQEEKIQRLIERTLGILRPCVLYLSLQKCLFCIGTFIKMQNAGLPYP